VLISLGILTLGLLGVAAVFPVGGWYMQKATIADNGSAIAQAVMNDIITRGTVNPKAWYSMVPASLPGSAHAPLTADGKYVNPLPPSTSATFTRPFLDSLVETLAKEPSITDKRIGNAFVIDPLYVSATVQRTSNANNPVAYAFPASAVRAFPRDSWAYYNATQWEPWEAANANERVWPIRRVTLQDAVRYGAANRGWFMSADMASHTFRSSDDLTVDFPSRADRPARQNWNVSNMDLDSNGLPDALARQRTGDFSWIVCVVPTTRAARDGMASSPESYSYDVSVVVFYKRVLPTELASIPPGQPGVSLAASYERAVSAKILSTSLNGGELLLQSLLLNGDPTKPVDGMPEDPFKNLKTGEWLMMCGPHPNSTLGEPRFVMKWYQVMSIDQQGLPKTQRAVTVRGPEWPWKPAANPGYSDGALSNDLCAAIFRGAVAVHTKTIKLEGEHGAGMALVKP
jgi:hypothetical protein